MRKFHRKDNDPVYMYYCDVPITMDQTSKWGFSQVDNPDSDEEVTVRNIQSHEKGCWVQLGRAKQFSGEQNRFTVSHLVADDGNGCPVGWTFDPGSKGYIKRPIYAEQATDEVVWMTTLDGPMSYPNPNKNGWMVYNEGSDSKPDLQDCWFMTNEQFKELYR